jgi:hypothetical protein
MKDNIYLLYMSLKVCKITSMNIGRKKITRFLALFPFCPVLFISSNFSYEGLEI